MLRLEEPPVTQPENECVHAQQNVHSTSIEARVSFFELNTLLFHREKKIHTHARTVRRGYLLFHQPRVGANPRTTGSAPVSLSPSLSLSDKSTSGEEFGVAKK